jgi:adenine-specific DNA-methyltransferase
MHPSLGQTDPEREKSTWSPPPYNSWKLYQNLSALPSVGDLFLVHQGTRTGNKPVFVLKRDQWEVLPKPEQTYFRPAVVNEAIQDGKLHIVSYVFYPYGEHQIRTEAELAELVPRYYQDYILPNREKLRARSRMKPDLWWTLSLSRNWQQSPKMKLVSTTFGDAGSFALDITGEFVVVQGLNWQPKKEADSISMQRKIYLAYLAILNSSLFSDLLAATSRQVSGGQWELAKQYVDPIPIPDFFDPQFSPLLIDELAHLGEQGPDVQGRNNARVLELLAPLYRLDM